MSNICKRCPQLRTLKCTSFKFFIIGVTWFFILYLLYDKIRWTDSTLEVGQDLDVWSRDQVCVTNATDECPLSPSSVPTAYVITPTYRRLTQEADLLRLCYTLMHVPHVRWIIVEDSNNKTQLVCRMLQNCHGVNITHLTARSIFSKKQLDANQKLPRHRGVRQRNTALTWIRKCVLPTSRAGGVFFADDDNTYDIRLFDVRGTGKVSMWKVGLAGGLLEEGPLCVEGAVTGWRTAFARERKYPVDMAAFAVGLDLLAQFPTANFSHEVKAGHLETEFLSLFNISTLEITTAPDDNCSTVLAWHTRTSTPNIKNELQIMRKG